MWFCRYDGSNISKRVQDQPVSSNISKSLQEQQIILCQSAAVMRRKKNQIAVSCVLGLLFSEAIFTYTRGEKYIYIYNRKETTAPVPCASPDPSHFSIAIKKLSNQYVKVWRYTIIVELLKTK